MSYWNNIMSESKTPSSLRDTLAALSILGTTIFVCLLANHALNNTERSPNPDIAKSTKIKVR